jgi:16S rRNA (guanine1207-N2)-methyltransferase
MMLRSSLLAETVQPAIDDRLLVLNTAADPFIQEAALRLSAGTLILAEDNIAALQRALDAIRRERATVSPQHIPFHEYTLYEPPATMDIAVMNTLYQPGKVWTEYALQLALYALKPGGQLYVQGAKDRGILTLAKRMAELFGEAETLEIHKGERVVRSIRNEQRTGVGTMPVLTPFAGGKLDEGTRMLLEALEVHVTDEALDMGCGAGYIGCDIARRARKGQVTMVDSSLAAVDAARHVIEQRGLTNARVLASDGTQAVREERFDLVVTNPPFHTGGIQTTEIGHRFIREAARVLRPRGRFYLVANRFIKYEPTMRECFGVVEEVKGDARFKVLRGTGRPSTDMRERYHG